MKILVALIVTVFLAVGATLVAQFGFRSPAPTPKIFSAQSFVAAEESYRSQPENQPLQIRWEPDTAKVEQGRLLYGHNCSTCHGPNGDGQPITPEGLSVAPRDFTGQSHNTGKVVFKFNTSNRDNMLASDEDLIRTIRDGLPGTPMPGFSELTEAETAALVEYVKSFGYVYWKYNHPDGTALEVPAVPVDFDASTRVEQGRGLFTSRGCVACHGDLEQGGQPLPALPTEWVDLEGNPINIAPRNFATEPLRRGAPEDVYQTIRLGINGTAMVGTDLPDEQTWDLVAYIEFLRQQGLSGQIPAR